ncbi:MAG: hypothetical protein IIA67_02975 [Planctomycetes bacterium]|nr:hypothetical protein [Planctomycetota bacterium]
MNISKLSSQIRREMTSDPKKAVILAGLLLLAGYYWAPLVWGWVSKGGANQQETQLAALAASNNPVQLPTAVPSGGENAAGTDNVGAPLHRWQLLVGWMDADPRTKPLVRVSDRRDPFADQTAARRRAGRSTAATARPITPANLGMKLTGIMIGARRRVALIDGRAYVPGEEIKVKLTAAMKQQTMPHDAKPDDDVPQASQGDVEKPRIVHFLLTEVRHRSVVLRRDNKSYELELPNPEPNDDAFVISFASRKASLTGP